MSYRLHYQRTSWLAFRALPGGWYGSRQMLVKGTIPARYGHESYYSATKAPGFIERATEAFADAEPVSLGEPFRRADTPRALDMGAWIRKAGDEPGLYVDADLVALAEMATGFDDWVIFGIENGPRDPENGREGPVLALGASEPVALVAPVRPAYLNEPEPAEAVAA